MLLNSPRYRSSRRRRPCLTVRMRKSLPVRRANAPRDLATVSFRHRHARSHPTTLLVRMRDISVDGIVSRRSFGVRMMRRRRLPRAVEGLRSTSSYHFSMSPSHYSSSYRRHRIRRRRRHRRRRSMDSQIAIPIPTASIPPCSSCARTRRHRRGRGLLRRRVAHASPTIRAASRHRRRRRRRRRRRLRLRPRDGMEGGGGIFVPGRGVPPRTCIARRRSGMKVMA